ncbi:HET-domain-containing protein [Lepidopterella palustris CBS 459.81]|uniref:HET-domain-containing protein n=1 Tax=Lepidopterella palustris CBS 459.81 TaxID=1314670 RepID=A0A8E2JD18_9PEZI|nr:HET-domain-containing protein [Lepidopterella palustris CBS 459.81]
MSLDISPPLVRGSLIRTNPKSRPQLSVLALILTLLDAIIVATYASDMRWFASRGVRRHPGAVSANSGQETTEYQKPNRFSLLRPILGPSIDWSLINKWIYECEHSHSELCHGSSTSKILERPKRVVDVHNNCIVNLPSGHEYVTLSYVWGLASLSKEILTAKISNFVSLKELGALSKRELPKTIEHAMEVCRRIGHQYLWVDSLCIVQDDQVDVREQIARMSDIYSGSFLTIIAAWGDNADAGLPGVLNGIDRDHQNVARFDGLEMIEVLPLLGDVLQHTSWKTRAWTQQEWLLSARRLYFTNVQVYFECRTALRNEDAWVMMFGNSNNPPEKLDNFGRLPNEQCKRSSLRWPRFRDLLEDYTSRRLSYSSDIFNACTGIYHHVYGQQGSRFVFGLPENDFCDALRWHSYQYTPRVPENTDFVIPSWSWGSTKAEIRWLRGSGWKSGETSEEGPGTIPLIQFEVCVEKDQTWTIVGQSSEDERMRAIVGKKLEFPTPISHHVPTPGRLRFRTQSAMFRLHGRIDYFDIEKDRDQLELEIGHRDGRRIARIDVALDWGLNHAERSCVYSCRRHRELRNYVSNPREMVRKMYENGWNQCEYVIRPRLFKFILISAINLPQHWTVSTLERYIEGKYSNVKEEVDTVLGKLEPDPFYPNPGHWKDLHVMLIEENKDKNAARRMGVTNLRLDDWLKSGPVMEDIVLE